jgi:hypothetical protein
VRLVLALKVCKGLREFRVYKVRRAYRGLKAIRE